MAAPIVFSNVHKRYGDRPVLAGVDLTIDLGKTVGLIGLNGAGKSTLLKTMLELTDIDQGKVDVFGVDHRQTRAREELAYLAESFLPPYYATGHDLLQFMARLHNLRPTAQAIVEESQALGLEPAVLQRPVREYSKGMRQKLGLVGCVLAKRRLFVLDEPMSGLDPHARTLFKARLERLKASGATVFFSTHLLDDVAQICDCIAVLHAGLIRYCGTVEDFQSQYPESTLEGSFLRCIGVATAT